tara:strand:+ start:640 stop:855 length:216 start_codon:yes stop_codon:yes gene_type:complete
MNQSSHLDVDEDLPLFWLEVDEESLDEILMDNGIVPCHLHRNLATDKLKANALSWVRSNVEELAEELRKNN